ncbi:hypothetical protein PGT21_021543 [Puccinia graminis f. sp. tritici]|uniref:Uncharacterized protein n=1 Tax=Puccinia graminis f. sp. tritici TaxID=56615 RepID=A0A5B0LRA0_PUCGR|nr:hypothetical protein PGTUg99_007108 [Puccinia graminis f. sp. tritici]KAA1071860.1 hypothetical protein PGT21_021543 [Puccinia graminis f. sp. tritici]
MTISHSLRLKTKHCFLLIVVKPQLTKFKASRETTLFIFNNSASSGQLHTSKRSKTLLKHPASMYSETKKSQSNSVKLARKIGGKTSAHHLRELELPNFFRLDDKDFLRLFSSVSAVNRYLT